MKVEDSPDKEDSPPGALKLQRQEHGRGARASENVSRRQGAGFFLKPGVEGAFSSTLLFAFTCSSEP
jgi:hypothetical protein